MLRSEFEILTGIYVDEEMMDVINERYIEMELDKHVFCEAYKSNMNGLAQIIQREANRRQFEKMGDINKAIKELNDKISGLKAELEKEQEWKPYGKNSAMNAVDYTRLLHGYQPMGKAAAARLVAEVYQLESIGPEAKGLTAWERRQKDDRIKELETQVEELQRRLTMVVMTAQGGMR